MYEMPCESVEMQLKAGVCGARFLLMFDSVHSRYRQGSGFFISVDDFTQKPPTSCNSISHCHSFEVTINVSCGRTSRTKECDNRYTSMSLFLQDLALVQILKINYGLPPCISSTTVTFPTCLCSGRRTPSFVKSFNRCVYLRALQKHNPSFPIAQSRD